MIKFLKKAYVGIILFVLYAPVALLMVFSFNDSKTPIWKGFTLKWYKELFSDPNIQSALYYTLIIALVSSFIATIIGTLAAIGIDKMTNWKKNMIMNITYIPLLSPDIVTGISLMLLYSAIKLPLGLPTLILSHVTFCIPYVILSVTPRLKQMNRNVYEAALDLGATPLYAFNKVILPEIFPGVISGAFIAFTLSIDDFVVSFFNTAAGVDTLSIQIYSMARRGVNPKINAISTIMFTFIMVVLVVVNLRANKQTKKGKQKVVAANQKQTTKRHIAVVVGVVIITLVIGFKTFLKKPKQQVFVYNWGDYIAEEVNKKFEEETGIEVVYSQYANNEEMYAKILGGGATYDIAIPSDYMIEKMIKEDMLHEIDTNELSNYTYIDKRFRNLPFDANNQYSVPYMWGTMGIVYNTKLVNGTIDSWSDMWDKQYAKQVFMYDSERDSIMVALKKLGYSMNTRDLKELEAAKNELITQKPIVKAYVGDEGKGMMINNEAALMLAWAGDAIVMTSENEDLDYVLPKEGTNLFVDAIVMLKNAPNVENAYKYIDFLCRPDISALNAEYIGYSTPSSEARKLLPDEIKNSEIAYPIEEETAKMEMFNDPTDVIEIYSRMWTEIKAGK